MRSAKQLFSNADKDQIAAAVRKAEEKTSAEIVPVVATASGRYDRAEDLVGLLTGLLLLAVGWLGCPMFHATGPWGEGGSGNGLVMAVFTVIVGFVAGAALASRVTFLRLFFLSHREMDEEVRRAAQSVFMSSRIRRTKGGTGVLLYVSLFERQVVVLPDDTICETLPKLDWNGACETIVDGMKRGRPTEALVQAIDECGDLLAEDFPHASDDIDELSNELVIID